MQAAALRGHAVRPADLSRRRALLHRRRHRRVRVRPELSDARMAHDGPHLRRAAHLRRLRARGARSWRCVLHRSVFGRYLFAVGKNEEAARYSGISTRDRHRRGLRHLRRRSPAISSIYFAMYTRSISPASHGNFYELYGIAAAVLGGCSLRGGEGSILGIVLGAMLLQILQNLVNLLGIPSLAQLRRDGDGDPDRRAGRPAAPAACVGHGRRARPTPPSSHRNRPAPRSRRKGGAS